MELSPVALWLITGPVSSTHNGRPAFTTQNPVSGGRVAGVLGWLAATLDKLVVWLGEHVLPWESILFYIFCELFLLHGDWLLVIKAGGRCPWAAMWLKHDIGRYTYRGGSLNLSHPWPAWKLDRFHFFDSLSQSGFIWVGQLFPLWGLVCLSSCSGWTKRQNTVQARDFLCDFSSSQCEVQNTTRTLARFDSETFKLGWTQAFWALVPNQRCMLKNSD